MKMERCAIVVLVALVVPAALATDYVLDEEELGKMVTPIESPAVGPRGLHIAWITDRGDGVCVFCDGTLGPEYGGIMDGTPKFSADGEHIAYGARSGDTWQVVCDGEAGPKYDGIMPNGPSFTGEGHLQYLAHKNGVLYRVTHRPVGEIDPGG